MADFTYQDIAATLASGILAAGAYDLKPDLKPLKSDQQAGIAVDLYKECLKQLLTPKEGEGPRVTRL